MIPSTSGPGLLGFIPFILSYQVCVHARWVFESSLESLLQSFRDQENMNAIPSSNQWAFSWVYEWRIFQTTMFD
jgi:hypothetical protein